MGGIPDTKQLMLVGNAMMAKPSSSASTIAILGLLG